MTGPGYTPTDMAALALATSKKMVSEGSRPFDDSAYVPQHGTPSNRHQRTAIGPSDASHSSSVDNEDDAVAPDGLRLTDSGNAARLVTIVAGRARFVLAWGQWIIYRDGRWITDPNEVLISELAKEVARRLLDMVAVVRRHDRQKLLKAADKAESAPGIAAMVKLARGMTGVEIDHEQLDANPNILNCLNGTVDLATGELRPHSPADLCSMQCPVNYDQAASAPIWERCLEQWQPDPTIREYLQREVGAGASGHPTETVSFHHGMGGNGKTKFAGAVQSVLGPYAVVPHRSLIVNTRNEHHPTVVASLFRARLAVASETSATDYLNESQVKNLTGGDRLAARRMRQDEWGFMPTHTMVMLSNHRPRIQGTDEGIWRRVRLIPWDVTIPENERDERLAEKLKMEAPGILRWIVEGCVRYLSEGLDVPDTIKASTAAYRADEDTVGRFLDDAGVVFEVGARLSSSKLRATHDAWCAEGDVATGAHWKLVTSELTRRGARARRSSNERRWEGITIPEGRHISPGQEDVSSEM